MSYRIGKIVFIICWVALYPWLYSYGQTNRYWANNFDQESFLLGGAVVGGGSSLGSIYYNPASIAFLDKTKVSLNSSIIGFYWYVIKNGLADGQDIRFNQFTVQPPYTSILLKNRNSRLSVEIAIITQEDEDFYVQQGK